MPVLVIREAAGERIVPLSAAAVTVGRTPDNTVILGDPKVSRQHCRISPRDGGFVLEDMGSSNGTFLNGTVSSRAILKDNDLITIGETNMVFRARAPQERTAAAFPPEVLKPAHPRAAAGPPPLLPGGERHPAVTVLYQIARAIVYGAKMQDVVDMALTLVMKDMNAERGAILAVRGKTLVPVAVRSSRKDAGHEREIAVSMTIAARAIEEKSGIITSDARYDPRFSEGNSITAYGIRSALCCPLWEEDKIIGAVYLDSLMTTHAFTEKDLDLLTALSHVISLGIRQEHLKEELRLDTILRNNLERFLSPEVVEIILKTTRDKEIMPLEVQERVASVIFVDIKDFTTLSEKLSPPEIAELLTGFFTRMSAVIFTHEGSVNKFIGDAMLAVFGAPYVHENDAERAVRASLDMIRVCREFNANISEHRRFAIRVGINTGKVVAGNIGSPNRMEYTVLGDAVNVAARLQNEASPYSVLIGEETYRWVRHLFEVKPLGLISLKGKKQALQVYEVIGPK